MNEIRNELLGILKLMQTTDNVDIYLSTLLDRFEYDIKDKLEDIENEKQELERNLETLKYVRKELKYKLGNFYKEEE